jgi:hypothetical protein
VTTVRVTSGAELLGALGAAEDLGRLVLRGVRTRGQVLLLADDGSNGNGVETPRADEGD